MPRNEAPVSARNAVSAIRDAYLRVKHEIDAVEDADLMLVNLDLQRVITGTRGRLERILGLLDRAKVETPAIDTRCFTKLEDYALAAAYTHVQYRATSASTDPRSLQLEAAEYRQRLLVDATALARRGQIERTWLAQLNRAKGYENTAFDLLTLYTHLRENWNMIEGKTVLELQELERAGAIADELMLAIGALQNDSEVAERISLNRHRAFTLFARAYNQVRRTVLFLRWDEGDGDAIAPSLYSGRRRSRAGKGRKQDLSEAQTRATRARETAPKGPTAAGETNAPLDGPNPPDGNRAAMPVPAPSHRVAVSAPAVSNTVPFHLLSGDATLPASAASNGAAMPLSATHTAPSETPEGIAIPISLPDNNPFGE